MNPIVCFQLRSESAAFSYLSRYNYGSTKDSLVKTRFHWHAHAVADLCFSTDGIVVCL